jgi:hypothetical protein
MTTNIKIRLAAATMLALSLIGTLGTGVAAAGSGHSYPGGGEWWWSNIPGIWAESIYWHPTKTHSASVRIGTRTVRSMRGPGSVAGIDLFGVGTTYVYWNTY